MSIKSLLIRPYRNADRGAVFSIAADTAFFGAEVENFLEDRRLFVDIFYRYYTDFEPEQGWVACIGGNVVGFLMGCANTRLQRRVLSYRIVPVALMKLGMRRYRLGRKTWLYFKGLVKAGLRQEILHPPFEHFPAHLHVNINHRWRGNGAGRQLMETYLHQLRNQHILGVHLNTTDQNLAACTLYERLGFQILEERSTSLWSPFYNNPVRNRCYGLAL